MQQPTGTKLRIGAWSVDPETNAMMRGDETVRLEPRMMRLLLCLAERASEVVSADELLEQVWPGVIVTPDSVYQAVASLRRVLGDNSKQPKYIVTVPRQGYRMIAAVAPWTEAPGAPRSVVPPIVSNSRLKPLFAIAALLILAVAIVYAKAAYDRSTVVATSAVVPPKSVAVLPLLDLTEEMREEVFADGMTEELIDKLSQIPNLRVPSPTASFFYKGKQMTVADIAGQLGVAYVLDGSVRKSGGTVRVAARLVRADDGFVVWSQTYDRDVGDLIMVQDDIADEVRKALADKIDSSAVHR